MENSALSPSTASLGGETPTSELDSSALGTYSSQNSLPGLPLAEDGPPASSKIPSSSAKTFPSNVQIPPEFLDSVFRGLALLPWHEANPVIQALLAQLPKGASE